MGHTDTRAAYITLTFWIHWLAGMGLVIALLVLFTFEKTGTFPSAYRMLATLTVVLSIPFYASLKVYRHQEGIFTGIGLILTAWLAVLASLGAIAFITKTTETYSREVVLVWAATGFLAQVAAFLPLRAIAQRYRRHYLGHRNSLIIGTGPLAQALGEKFHTRSFPEPLRGFVAVCNEDKDKNEASKSLPAPIIGHLAALRQLIAEHQIHRVYIALPLQQAAEIEGLYIDLLDASVDVVWVPDLANLLLLSHSVHDLDGLPAIYLNESPLTAFPSSARLKAIFDRVAALLGILLLSPLLITVALAIKLTSPGPIIFRQPRHGWNGQVFKVWKFRSMRLNDDTEIKQATREDDRITCVGRFIRRTSIDELPQLFNVLCGEMSLVGPRPHAVQHNNYYSDKIRAYMVRHRIKPGITGLAQISGFRGETETLEKMQKRVEVDLEYINNWSLWLDIKILLKTPFALFSKEAY